HALAQPCLGHLDTVEPAGFEHGEDRLRAGEDDVAALGLDPPQLAALPWLALSERADELGERVPRDDVTLDAERRDVAQPLVGGGEVSRRAADRDEPGAGDHPELARD